MRLKLIRPRVEPTEITPPSVCAYDDCEGKHFAFHQAADKAVRDTVYDDVVAHRYECLRCKRAFRVYPKGVTRAQTSLRVHGLSVLLCLLGLSCGAVSLTLEALGTYLCKSQAYEIVQAFAERVLGLRREQMFERIRTSALGGGVTSVRCNGQWLALGFTLDDTTGLVLTVDDLTGEDAQTLRAWIEPIVQAVGAKILVTDDADGFKTVADELGLEHQVGKSHVKRNTEALIESLESAVRPDADGSLAAIGVTPEEALGDFGRLGELIVSRRPDDGSELGDMHRRYLGAAPPAKGETATLAYRSRLFYLDRWNLWPRLTRYRAWQGPNGETLDGTNNSSERAIGWWIKERYRTMRGYKRPKSAVNISRLLAWCGNHLNNGGADLALLAA